MNWKNMEKSIIKTRTNFLQSGVDVDKVKAFCLKNYD